MGEQAGEQDGLAGRVAIVTGASGGIGGGIARRLHDAGATVVRQHHSHPLTAAAGAIDVQVDLTADDGPAELLAAAADLGGPHILVNAAGIQPVVALADMTDDDWREVIDVNLTAAHRLAVAAAKVMAADGGGAIVQVASIEGHQPAAGHAHYAASKAGLVMHTRALALEFGSAGVRVNSVSPGLIDRPGLAQDWPQGHARWLAAAPLGRLGTPEDVAEACLFLVSDRARWITGTDLVVDGGVSARPTW